MGNCSCGRSNRPSKKDSTILTEEEIRFLLNNTKLNREQINSLHYSFLEECQNGKMYKRDFLKLFKKAHPSENRKEKPNKFCDYVFRVIDAENRGYITFKDFLLCLNLTSFGDFKQKCEFAFKLYDLDKDNKISKKEMTQVLEALYDLSGIVDRKGEKSPVKKAEDVMNKLNGNLNESPKKKRDYITQDQFIDACCNDLTIKNLLIDSIFANTSYEDDRAHSKDSLVGGKPKLCFLCAFKSMQTSDDSEKRDNFKTNASSQQVANINLTEFQPVIQSQVFHVEDKTVPLAVDAKSVSNYSYQEPIVNIRNPSTQYSQDTVVIGTNLKSEQSNLKLDEKEVYQFVDKYAPQVSTSYHLLDASNAIPIEITIRRGNAGLIENRSPSQNYIQQRTLVESTESFTLRDPVIPTRTNDEVIFFTKKDDYMSAPIENKPKYEPHIEAKIVLPDLFYSDQVQKVESTSTAEKLPKLDENELFRFVDKCTEESKITYLNADGTFEEETTHNIDITLPNNTAADYVIIEKENKLEVELIDGFIQDRNLDKRDVKIESVTKEIASTRYFEPVNGDQVNIENVTTDIVFDVNLAEKDTAERVVTQIPVEIENADDENENVEIRLYTNPDADMILVQEPVIILKKNSLSPETKEDIVHQDKGLVDNEPKENNLNFIPMTRMASELHEELKMDNKIETPEVSKDPIFEEKNELEPIEKIKSVEKDLNPNQTSEDTTTRIINELDSTSSSKDVETSKTNNPDENLPTDSDENKISYTRSSKADIDSSSLSSENNQSDFIETKTKAQISATTSEENKPLSQQNNEENKKEETKEQIAAKNDSAEIANIVTEIVTNVSEESDTEIVVETKPNETIVEISSNSDFEMKIKTTDDNGNNIITTIKAEQIPNEEIQAEAEIDKEVKSLLEHLTDKVNEENEPIIAVIQGDLDKAPVSLDIQADPSLSIEEVTVEIEKKENKDDTKKNITNLEIDDSYSQNEIKNDIANEVVNIVKEIVDLSVQKIEIKQDKDLTLEAGEEKNFIKTESNLESVLNSSPNEKPNATS